MLKLLVINAMLYGVSGHVLDNKFIGRGRAVKPHHVTFIFIGAGQATVRYTGALIKDNAVLTLQEITRVTPADIRVGAGYRDYGYCPDAYLIQVQAFHRTESLGPYGLAILVLTHSFILSDILKVAVIRFSNQHLGKDGLIMGWNQHNGLLKSKVEIVGWENCPNNQNFDTYYYLCVKTADDTTIEPGDGGLPLTTMHNLLIGMAIKVVTQEFVVFANVPHIFAELRIHQESICLLNDRNVYNL